jgi:hypothetical protein
MKINNRLFFASLLGYIIALVPGCSTSILVNQWNDTSYRGPGLTNLMIIAVRNDPVKRRTWEDVFSEELAGHGVKSTQSYRLFPNGVPDSDQIAEAVAKNGFEGIVINRSLPKGVTATYVNGYVSTESETRFSERRQQFRTYYREVAHPGYVDTQKIANHSIDVWTTDANSRMIWSAISQSAEPAPADDIHHDVAKLVIGDLVRKGIFAKAK